MKKFSPVGCCIDKRQKSRGTVKINFTGWSKENSNVLSYLGQQQGENVREQKKQPHTMRLLLLTDVSLVIVQGVEVLDWPSCSPDLNPVNLIFKILLIAIDWNF